MAHWYRDPKQLKLTEHLERAGFGFVLSREDFSESDLLDLQARLHTMSLAQRLTLGTISPGDSQRVSIVAPRERSAIAWLQNPEPWAGIFVLPRDSPQREDALATLLASNGSFNNGTKGRRVISRGILHRFVLDMSAVPPVLHRIKEDWLDQKRCNL
jgi:hypothetical protein